MYVLFELEQALKKAVREIDKCLLADDSLDEDDVYEILFDALEPILDKFQIDP